LLEHKVISAPLPAALPTDSIFFNGKSGINPILTALFLSIKLPNAPAKNIS
jgi:hypothetical protein